MILHNVGTLRNEYGSILAGGDMTIGNADPSGNYRTSSVTNTGGVLTRDTVVEEYSFFRWNRNYNSATAVSVAPQASSTVSDRVGGTISAGGNLSIYADTVVNTNALPGQSNTSGAATPGVAGAAFALPSLSLLAAATGGQNALDAGSSINAVGAVNAATGQGAASSSISLTGSQARVMAAAAGGLTATAIGQSGLKQTNRVTSLSGGTGELIATGSNTATTVPNSALFHAPTQPGVGYLIETDARFANYKQWLSSDYLLNALGLDPAALQKRLGDGFYEQKLIREQVAQLTGRRFLGDYRSDDETYQALMNNSVSVARQWRLRPGIALTPKQLDRLTSDIVWLVEQEVVLADGSTTKALVPVVYLSKIHKAELRPTGALVFAQNLAIHATGELLNNGALQAQGSIGLDAHNVSNELGRIEAAQGGVRVTSGTDIVNRSGLISGNAVQLEAARDIQIDTLTRQFESSQSTIAGLVSGSNTEVGPPVRFVRKPATSAFYQNWWLGNEVGWLW